MAKIHQFPRQETVVEKTVRLIKMQQESLQGLIQACDVAMQENDIILQELSKCSPNYK